MGHNIARRHGLVTAGSDVVPDLIAATWSGTFLANHFAAQTKASVLLTVKVSAISVF